MTKPYTAHLSKRTLDKPIQKRIVHDGRKVISGLAYTYQSEAGASDHGKWDAVPLKHEDGLRWLRTTPSDHTSIWSRSGFKCILVAPGGPDETQ